MITRLCYSLWQWCCHYSALKKTFHQPASCLPYVMDLSRAQLHDIDVLVLDFDGVLAPHGAAEPLPKVQKWLSDFMLKQSCSIYILSNKPNVARKAWFAKHYPKINFISGVRKKPYPDGLQKIAQMEKVAIERIVLVDDRLATGILATKIAGCQGLFITRPYQDKITHPIKERFFSGLRYIEQWMLR